MTTCGYEHAVENAETGKTVVEELKTEPENDQENTTTETLKESEDFSCAICFELIVPGDGVLELPCYHLFHSDCIVQWLLNHQHCPICRTLLPHFEFQQDSGPSNNSRQLVETEENTQSYHLTRLHFSDGIRRTSRLLFLQPGRHIKRSFLQVSSFLKLVFHEMSEPFHTSSSPRRYESGRHISTSRRSSRAVHYRENTNRALEPPRRSKKKNIFRRFWSHLVHKNSSSRE